MRKAFLAAAVSVWGATALAAPPEAIKTVEVSADHGWKVNGKPFFPIMGWLQGSGLSKIKDVGCNTIAGFHRAGKPVDAIVTYADKVRDAGLYFMPGFEPDIRPQMETLKTRHGDIVLAWMHADEPDLPHNKSDAKIHPGADLLINNSRPLYLMVDGLEKTSAVLDPINGAQFSIGLPPDAKIKTIALANSGEPKTTVAKDVTISLGGKEVLKTTLKPAKGLQKFDLAQEASGDELVVRIDSVEGDAKWGAIAEVQALDASGRNVLLAPVKKVPNMTVEEVQARFAAFKKFDASRPMLMTTTPFFLKGMEAHYAREIADRMYPGLIKETDVVGFDHYPLYGWNQPNMIPDVSRGMDELKAYGAKGKPMYQWIETKSGGKFGAKAVPVTGVEIRNEVWQAIIHGATAIGYFTHEFTPKFSEFAVPEENQKAITEINAQLTRLTPVLLAGAPQEQAAFAIPGDAKAQCMTRAADGTVLIVAQALDPKGKMATGEITLKSLKAGASVEVVDENRTITAADGKFEDKFDRLAVHIYRIKP